MHARLETAAGTTPAREDGETLPVARVTARRVSRGRWATTWLHRAAVAVILFALLALATHQGLRFRGWAFTQTVPIRFTGDVTRGWGWGYVAHHVGWLNIYDPMAQWQTPRSNLWIDYAPLRLAVMKLWADANARDARFPEVSAELGSAPTTLPTELAALHARGARLYQNTLAFTGPALRINAAMEWLAAAAAFLLAREWVVRGDRPRGPSLWAGLRRRFRRAGRDEDELPPARGAGASDAAEQPRPVRRVFRGCGAGLGAFLLCWFNPAMVLSAHGWPTWDMWVVPFYLWAVLFACRNWWFVAGVTVGLGALAKGQQWLVAPLFVIWPLAQGRPGAAARWACGAVFAVGAATCGWNMARLSADASTRAVSGGAVAWVATLAVGLLVLPIVWRVAQRRFDARGADDVPARGEADEGAGSDGAGQAAPRGGRTTPRWLLPARLGAGVVLAIVAIAPARHVDPPPPSAAAVAHADRQGKPITIADHKAKIAKRVVTILLVGAVAVGALAAAGSPRAGRYAAAAAVGAGSLLSPPLFGGSWAWAQAGWGYGTVHWPWLIMGKTSNLAGLLAGRFGWDNFRDAAWVVWRDVPWVGDVTFKALMYAIFLVMLTACAVAAAAKDRRNDRTFLIAVTAPWVLFFAFGTQVHERYLLFAAGVASVLAACGVGWVLLGLFLTAVTFAMTIDVMLGAGRAGAFGNGVYDGFGRDVHEFVLGTHPDIGWAVILVALIFLYKAVVPGRRRLVVRDV